MPKRPKIFEVLRDCPDLAADETLVTGIVRVPPEHQREIINVLLQRDRDDGLRELPVIFDKLDEQTQTLVVANTAMLFSALRANIRSSVGQSRLNTLEIIRRSGCLRLAYLVAYAFNDGSEKVRTYAGAVLRQLNQTHFASHRETTELLSEASEPDSQLARTVVQTLKLLCEERAYLVTAIRDSLNTFESHHRPEVVEAAMYLADELEDALFQNSTRKLGKLTQAMLDIFGGRLSPHLAGFTYISLGYQELRKRIVSALTACRDTTFFNAFIRYHWLARDPSIRRNLQVIRDLNWLNDGVDAAFALPEEAATLMPSWLLAMGLPSEHKVSLLLNLLLVDHRDINRAATWALTRINTPASTLALQGLLDHDDPSLVKMARREIEHRQRLERRAGNKPRMDRPEEWARLLDRAGLSEDYDELWHHFDRLHPQQARVAGHHALKYVAGFLTQTQIKLLSPQPVERLRALNLIAALYVADQFTKDIFTMANDPIAEIRAAAMRTMAGIGDATTRRILERGIEDDNPLVQMAAIDALDVIKAKQRLELLLPKTDNANPDVRAAAVRILLKAQVPQAAAALIQMIQDERADHRCAALWVVDQLRLTAMARRVGELARSDPDPRIARIAQHVLKRIQRWPTRPSAPGAPAATSAPAVSAPVPQPTSNKS